jgi:hypothetical protein
MPFKKGEPRHPDAGRKPGSKNKATLEKEAKQPKPFVLSEFLFDKQLLFVEDPKPFKVAVCSRRAGKSIACVADLINTALSTPDILCLYITLSRANARKLIWRELLKINREFRLHAKLDSVELSITFPNNSVIYCSGAKDESEIEKFRGLPIKLCYLDECQSFRPYIRELIDDVIAPALMDYAGSLCLIGTPAPIPTGYFYECATKNDEWSKHSWTFFDNKYIAEKSGKTHQQLLERELKRRGVTADDPSIQREWFGKWVLDTDCLWLHYDKAKDDFDQLPKLPEPHKYNYIFGIDLGYEDADAIAVLAWSDISPTTFLVEELVVKKQGLTELVDAIKRLQTKYTPDKIIIDEGGLGKKLAEEIRRRHHIPVQPADKTRKHENAMFLNDSLRTGLFKAKASSFFTQDTFLVEIDRAKSTPDKIKLSDKYHSDIIDAVLYAFKESPAYSYQPPEEQLKPGTSEWAIQENKRMFEAELEGLQKESELYDSYGFGKNS